MRLKDVSICNPNYTGPDRDDSVAFVPMESLRYNAIDQQEISFADGKGKYTYFADGDLLFAKVTPCFENGNIAVAKGLRGGIGFGSSEIFVLRACRHVTSEYLFYIAQGSPFRDGAIATMSGVGGLKRIDPLFTKTFEFDVPSLNAQQRIVNYLDEKTAAIDGKVAVLEKKLAAYKRLKKSVINRAVTRGLDPNVKLKDSCVDWIGQVPERWKIKRFKDVLNYTTGVTPDSKKDAYFEVGGNNTWITIGDMNEKVVSTCSLSLSDRALVEFAPPTTTSGSLMFSFKLSIGKVAFAGKDLTTNEAIASVKPSGNYSLGYLYYYLPLALHANAGENIYGAEMLNQKIIRNMFMAFPFVVEQQAIADYLDAECAKIDRAAEIVTKQIDAYKRLKRSLINEVVTGKRKVA